MKPGEIYLANFPYGDVPGMKLRPVLLLTGPLSLGKNTAKAKSPFSDRPEMFSLL